MSIQRIAIYCGSNSGREPHYREAAVALVKVLAARGIDIVYGGASVGLMGEIANTALSLGRQVYGVIPQALIDKEIAHNGLSEMHVVQTMHERKLKMSELADGFIALPGGLGTLEEIFEMLTWQQLEFHQKPCAFLNVSGYYNHLLQFLQHTVDEGFVRDGHHQMILHNDNAEALVDAMLAFKPITVRKWIN